MSVSWNLWHGCRKISEGCRNCYVYRQDAQYDKDSSVVHKTANFDLPVKRRRDGRFKIPSAELIITCLTSDFLLEEADNWRREAWDMIRLRRDLQFFFITKRIDRFMVSLPEDWGEGYENVAVGCTVENQAAADYRLPIFLKMPIRHRVIICAPLLENLDISQHLDSRIEEVSIGGESGNNARLCDYDWVLNIRRQCIEKGIPFDYHQTGARLLKDGHQYRIGREHQHSQARKANISVK